MSAFAYSSKIFEAVVIIVLCVIFLQFFGLSTFEKWQRKDIQVVRRKEPKKCLPPPAVTICAITNELMGWNRTDTDVFGLDNCKGEEDLEECVEKFTFTLDDLLRNSSMVTNSKEKGVMKDQEFFGKSAWTSKMTDAAIGMCHTFIQDKPLCQGTYLHFILNYNITAVLFILYIEGPQYFCSLPEIGRYFS